MTEAQFRDLKVGDIVIGTNIGQKPSKYGGIEFEIIGFYRSQNETHPMQERIMYGVDCIFGLYEVVGYPLCKPVDGSKVHITDDMKRSHIPEERNGDAKLFYSCRSIKLKDS